MRDTKSLFFIGLVQLISISLFSCSAFCRERNPPEIQALIGMKIPPKTEQKVVFDKETGRYELRESISRGKIPLFTPVDQELLTNYKNTNSFGFEAGYIGKTACLLVVLLSRDQSFEISDAIAIHPGVPEWQMRNGKVVYDSRRYRLSTECSYSEPKKAIGGYIHLIGFVKPLKNKSDCAHVSGRVGQAWGVDGDTGKILEISTADLKCSYFTMDDCE